MILYLLDTNVISETLRARPDVRVMERLREHEGEIAIAAIVWHELWFGCLRLPSSTRRHRIEYYLKEVIAATVPVLPYDERAALWHSQERVRLAQIGRTPPFADGQIAAVAATNSLTLVTFNQADYAAFQGLRMEDWRVAG